jgi:Tfp pilus assembly protein PilF
VLARRGDDERAINEYRTALRLNPNLYDAHMNYGAILSRRGAEAEAIREFEEATRLRPRSAEPYVYLALAQANRRLFADAAANIGRAISIDHDASNRFLTNAVRLPADAQNIDRYLAFLRQQGR